MPGHHHQLRIHTLRISQPPLQPRQHPTTHLMQQPHRITHNTIAVIGQRQHPKHDIGVRRNQTSQTSTARAAAQTHRHPTGILTDHRPHRHHAHRRRNRGTLRHRQPVQIEQTLPTHGGGRRRGNILGQLPQGQRVDADHRLPRRIHTHQPDGVRPGLGQHHLQPSRPAGIHTNPAHHKRNPRPDRPFAIRLRPHANQGMQRSIQQRRMHPETRHLSTRGQLHPRSHHTRIQPILANSAQRPEQTAVTVTTIS
ncbi:hypothetical protein MSIMFI_05513 [Mycobacterium simulans]|nr:hypothetical protein MSIMFI_05513 [Mycobacterium simulans]